MNDQKIPLPVALRHLQEEPPLHLSSGDVARLLEHWGVTRRGSNYVRKLMECGVLTARRFPLQRGLRFETAAVFGYYRREIQR